MKIEPAYVSFEQAKLLKEKGFNIVTRSKYIKEKFIEDHFLHNYNSLSGNGGYEEYSILFACPEQWQVVEWLRVKYGIWVAAIPNIKGDKWKPILMKTDKDDIYDEFAFNSPEEACSAAFDYVLTQLI